MKRIIGALLVLLLQVLLVIFGAVIYREVWNNSMQVLGLILFVASMDVIGTIFVIDKFFCKVN